MIPAHDPSNFQNCLLCGIQQNDSLGLLVLNERITVHVACMAYSTGVWYRSDTEESMFIPGPDNRVIFNKKCRPHTVGFGDAVAKSQLCCGCNNRHATLRCSRVGCNKSFHIPCAIAAKGKSFIFHAKMVFFGEEKLLNGSAIGVLRSGRFLVCRHHTEWDRNPIWNRLQSYISERPALVNAISIDVDLLPPDLQIAVSKASQMSIFSPEENRDAISAASQRALTGAIESLCFTDVDGSVLELPPTHWIKWDSKTWQIPSRSRLEAEAQKANSLVNAEARPADDDRALANQSATGAVDGGKSKIVRKTPVAEKTVPASVPVPTTEHIQVPLGLSTFVTLPLFATVMQKVKEQSNATSVSVSCDEKSSKISITITASTVEAKTLARKLVEEELSKSLVIQTSKNKLQKQKKTSDEDDASDSPDPIPVPSPVKTKTLPPTKVKPTLPEKSKPVEVLPVVKDRAIDEVSVRQSAVSSSSVTQLKASDKGKGKTDGLSALLQAMKQLPDSEGPLYCGTCASSEENKVLGKMLVCCVCEIPVHTNCTDGYGEIGRNGKWKCAACLDPRATQCCFCETKSTQLLRRPTYPNCYSWVHTVCLHANYLSLNQLKKKTSKKNNSDSDSDSDDEGAECSICAEDEVKMVDLQRVKCTVKDCPTAFHMSCAWLAGHKISKVECPQATNRGAPELFLPITYRLNAFCEEHSGGHKSLVKREGLDSMVISEAVHKEAWRESNAYRKDKPLSLKIPEPVEPSAFGDDDSDSRSDSEDEESSVESDASDRPPSPTPTRAVKPRGRPAGLKAPKPTREPVKAKSAHTTAQEPVRPKIKVPKFPLKSREAVITHKGAPVKKTMTYGSIVAAATAKAAAVAAAAKAAAVTAAAVAAATARSNYMKKSINVTPRVPESSAYTEARQPLKNPEKQAEYKAARLKKLQAASELTMAEAAQLEAIKKKHEFDDIVMKVKLQRHLQHQKDSAVMLQCFGSLLEEAFTCASQLWGNDRSLMDRWSQSESLPKLHWEYMLSEDDFKSRGFTIVINPSTIDSIQVFGLDPLEKESAGSSVLRMVVDSAFAIFCGQVPSMKIDVVLLVHGEASSGRSIGRQLAAMNIHHESCYYLVAFSRNALFTDEPERIPSPPPLPVLQLPPQYSQPLGIAPSFSMVQNTFQNRVPFIQYDTLQSIGRATAIASPLQHYSRPPSPTQQYTRPSPPLYPNAPPSHYPPGFSPETTARHLSNVSSDSANYSEHDDRHLPDREKKSKKSKGGEHSSRPPYSPPKKSHTPKSINIYGDGDDSRNSSFPVSSSSNRESSSSYGPKSHSDSHRDSEKSKSNSSSSSSRTDRVVELQKDNKRKHSQSIEDERGRSKTSSSHSNTTSTDRRSSKDTSRDNSRDHSTHHSRGHSKDRPKDHASDHSRDNQRGHSEAPSEPPGQLCKFFSMGTCKYGNGCRSVHSRPSDPKPKSQGNTSDRSDRTERCEKCGRYTHPTSKCDEKHPHCNSSYNVSNIRWADSRYGKMWKALGFECTQPGVYLKHTAPQPPAKKPKQQHQQQQQHHQHYGGGYNGSY